MISVGIWLFLSVRGYSTSAKKMVSEAAVPVIGRVAVLMLAQTSIKVFRKNLVSKLSEYFF